MESEVICELNDLLILNYSSSSMVEFRSEKFPADNSSFNKGNAGETSSETLRLKMLACKQQVICKQH